MIHACFSENQGEYSVPCNPAQSTGAKVVTIVSSVTSAAILLLPIFRVGGLHPRHSETDTLFWWSIFLGFLGYGLWTVYFMHCHHLHGSAFPIFVACAFGTLAYLCFLAVATRKTTTSADARLGFAMVAPVALFFIAIQYKSTNHHYIGWINLGLSVVSHLCRIESTDYHGEIDRFLLFVSFVGAVNGFLWLIHPQLCLSREYKVNSYIVGVLRGGGRPFTGALVKLLDYYGSLMVRSMMRLLLLAAMLLLVPVLRQHLSAVLLLLMLLQLHLELS
ncbi:hypothetical protein BS78_K302300 [Paspalum vaginatum]|uniref:Uncharacterized protein n=1 Tax=Paspalum vaginatum TaxID=158149 RepID=A0A9W8CEQ2_9POAL|nr:hypothetical protein BS78_K302300 [Paspalum vaginatum]